MTVLKTPYSIKGQNLTWELAAYNAAEYLFNKFEHFVKNGTPIFHSDKTEIENLRNCIDQYINSKLYLVEVPGENKNSSKVYINHEQKWAILAGNAYAMIKKNYPDKYFTMIDVVMTIIKKQRDYGRKNIEKFAITGLVIRVHDKIARAENLLTKVDNKNDVENESLFDTLLDIVGYSIIATMWLNGTFMLELEKK
jgi:hypothetical protein